MAGKTGKQTVDLKKQLLAEGHRFSFVQAIRFLIFLLRREEGMNVGVDDIMKRIQVRPELSLSFPETDVASIKTLTGEPHRYSITTTFLGLYGSGSPLPTFYTEDLLLENAQDRSISRDFIDIFNSRIYSLYFAAWGHCRLFYKIAESRDAESLHRLYCLLGFEGDHLRNSLDDAFALLRYIGLFSQLPRSAEGLRALLADALGASVEIEQAVERMAPIPEDQRFYLGQRGNCLGETSYLGKEIADRLGKFRIQIGPASGESFERLLPGKPLYQRMCSLIRTYLDQPLLWDADIVLDPEDLAMARLGEDSWSQLGFNTWIYSGAAPEDVSCRLRCAPL